MVNRKKKLTGHMSNTLAKPTEVVTIDRLAIVAKLSDGTVRQVCINDTEHEYIGSLLNQLHDGQVKIFEEPLAIDLTKPEQS